MKRRLIRKLIYFGRNNFVSLKEIPLRPNVKPPPPKKGL